MNETDKLMLNEARTQNWDVVLSLIDKDANINAKTDKTGETALTYAAYYAGTDVLKALIDRGADIEAVNSSGFTPLYITVDTMNLDSMRFLLEAGANPDVKTKNGTKPIYVPFMEKNQQMYDLLMEFNCPPASDANVLSLLMLQYIGEDDYHWFVNAANQDCKTLRSTFYSMMIIQPVAAKSNLNFLKTLIDTGWSVLSTDAQGNTLLHIAAQVGELENVKYLMEKGLKLTTRNKHGETPIHLAVKAGFWFILKFALEQGIDVVKLDDEAKGDFNTLLHCAAEGGNIDIVKYLIENGADVNKFNSDGTTPLMAAAEKSWVDVAKILIDAGADVNARKKQGPNDTTDDKTVANMGINETEYVKMTIVGPAGWRKQFDDVGSTALHMAIKRKEDEKSNKKPSRDKRLIQKSGYSPDKPFLAPDDDIKDKMAYVTQMREDASKLSEMNIPVNDDPDAPEKMVALLLQSKANPNIVNRRENTPLFVAIEKGNFPVVKALLDSGARYNLKNVDKKTPRILAKEGVNKRIFQLINKLPKIKVAPPDEGNAYDKTLCEPERKEVIADKAQFMEEYKGFLNALFKTGIAKNVLQEYAQQSESLTLDKSLEILDSEIKRFAQNLDNDDSDDSDQSDDSDTPDDSEEKKDAE